MSPIAKALQINGDMRRLSEMSKKVIDQDGNITNDSDYEYCREQYKRIIDNANEVSATLMELAMAGENPKMYEAVARLIEATTKSTEALASLNIQRDMIQAREEKPEELSNPKVVFKGTMADLQQLIKGATTELEVTK